MTIRAKRTNKLYQFSLVLVFCSFTFIIGVFADCGFGITKIEAVLNRKKPPQVYLLNTTISVNARAQTDKARNYTAPLATQLESGLIDRDRRLSVEHSKPDNIITCTITLLTSAENWENRTTKERKKTGTQQVYNDKKKQNETKDVYQDVDVTNRYKVISAEMNVSYQVKDTAKNAQLDSANIPTTFKNSYLDGNGAPSLEEVEQTLVRRTVDQITPRLTHSIEPVKVMLPKCQFEAASNLGKAGLWQRMLETLIKVPPLKNPKDEAYRYYAIGLANEALAYQTGEEDLDATKKFLADAAENFKQAIDTKPEEKYFTGPQIRIGAAIADYQKLADQRTEYAKALSAKSAGQKEASKGKAIPERATSPSTNTVNPAPENKTLPTTQGATLTNQGVIALVKRGLSEALILQHIKSATDVQFDTTTLGIIDLNNNKVPESIIMAMMDKQTATQTTAPKKAPAPTRRKPKP